MLEDISQSAVGNRRIRIEGGGFFCYLACFFTQTCGEECLSELCFVDCILGVLSHDLLIGSEPFLDLSSSQKRMTEMIEGNEYRINVSLFYDYLPQSLSLLDR